MTYDATLDSLDLDALLDDRIAFNKLIYTPLGEALNELEVRGLDDTIESRVDVPEIMQGNPKAVIFRQVITPNYEIRRFVGIADSLNLEPVFFDHHTDKFVSVNEWKYYLGRLCFYISHDKQGNARQEYARIIDFNKYEGSPIDDILTLWGQPLVSFHRELFLRIFPNLEQNIFSASSWLKAQGNGAGSYYAAFLSLFLKHGILFENFLLDKRERAFMKEVLLPSFLSVYKRTGHKPLIVPLEPTEIEGEQFWMCHPYQDKEITQQKLGGTV